MEAKDLMIGDWVCYSRPNNYCTKVEGINRTSDGELDYIRCHRDPNDRLSEKQRYEDFALDILSFIPLTPEILKRTVGFTTTKMKSSFRKRGLVVD